MSPYAAEALSIALYLIPAAVLFARSARRDLSALSIALRVPFVVAIDLLTVLAASYVVPLEAAVLLSRAGWIVFGAVTLARRFWAARPAWPAALDRRAFAAMSLAAAVAVTCSVVISRRYLVHDRHWHGLLVTTMATQKLPFTNVFDGTDILHYHVSGDVLAAELRALSFNVLSSHRALSVAHDLLFLASAATVALAMIALGNRRAWSAALGGFALLLSGPMPLRGFGHELSGYAFHHFLSLSFRPHVPLAALLMIGFITAIGARFTTRSPPLSAGRAIAVMAATLAALAITDEASTALLGLGLAVTWLFCPQILGARRSLGLLALSGLALAAIVSYLLFTGSLDAGGPVRSVGWAAAARVPSVFSLEHPALLLATRRGLIAFFCDLLPVFACAIGLWLAVRRERRLLPAAVFASAVTIVAVLLGTHIDINHEVSEAQRFFLAPFFAAMGFAVLVLHRAARRSAAKIALLSGIAVSPIFTIAWLYALMPLEFKPYVPGYRAWLIDDLYDVDCRGRAGARLFETARPTYVETTRFFLFTACRAIIAPGYATPPWPTKIYPQFDGLKQLRELDRGLVDPGAPLDAICFARGGPTDVVCARALERRDACRAEGRDFLRCSLLPADRRALIRK